MLARALLAGILLAMGAACAYDSFKYRRFVYLLLSVTCVGLAGFFIS